jgi:hypothetical protein
MADGLAPLKRATTSTAPFNQSSVDSRNDNFPKSVLTKSTHGSPFGAAVEDGINAVRVFLPKCWFNAKKCARGIDALKLYRAEYDDKLQALRPRPVHDWTSHAADSFRYLALTLDRKETQSGFYRRIEYSQLGVV